MIVNNKKEIEKLELENPDKRYKSKEDVISINLSQYEGFEVESFESFNEACDEFYSSKVKNEITGIQEAAWNKKVSKFSKRLEKQEETLHNF